MEKGHLKKALQGSLYRHGVEKDERINRLELLRRLTEVTDGDVEAYMQKSDAEVDADLHAAGVDVDAAWRRFQRSVAHITGNKASADAERPDPVL